MHDKNSWLSDRPVFKLLLDRRDLIGCEIGIGGGANARNMLEYLDIKRLYLVDQYLPYENLKYHGVWATKEEAEKVKKVALEYLDGYKDKIVWIHSLSKEAVCLIDEQLDFVYIDGNHRYEYVKMDIELYLPKVKKGGIICGHDFNHEDGVNKAVLELFGNDFSHSKWDWWKIV